MQSEFKSARLMLWVGIEYYTNKSGTAEAKRSIRSFRLLQKLQEAGALFISSA